MTQGSRSSRRSLFGSIPRPVLLLALVSFFTDISSEMVYPLIPLFLTSSIGAPAAAVGVIEGVAESTASLAKAISGWLSDRLRVRKPLVVAGYSLSAIGKPLLAAATVWPAALAARFVDRLGKGVRTAPRDALLGDAADDDARGLAFGLHRAADTLGAALGPAIGLGLFVLFAEHFRPVFLIAFIPAAAGVAVLMFVREGSPAPEPEIEPQPTTGVPLRELGGQFYLFLGISLLFALGNSSDAFLILRADNLGLSHTETILAYVLFNSVYAAGATPGGVLSDRVGRRGVIASGFAIFAAVYLGLAVAGGGTAVWPLFALYGVFMSLTEAVSRAFVVDFAPPATRGTAIGVYTGSTGAMILASSIIAGVLWDIVGPWAPFAVGAFTGGTAAVLVALFLRDRRSDAPAAIQ